MRSSVFIVESQTTQPSNATSSNQDKVKDFLIHAKEYHTKISAHVQQSHRKEHMKKHLKNTWLR